MGMAIASLRSVIVPNHRDSLFMLGHGKLWPGNGEIYLEWWGSTHRLFMRVESNTGSLDIVGEGVEPYSDPSGSPLAEYSHRRRFAGNSFHDSPPLPESFSISIVGSDLPGGAPDHLEFEYGTQRCTCRYRDW